MKSDWRHRMEQAVQEDGRSLRDISMAAGLSHGYLHGILRDNKEPTLDRFLAICKAMNVSSAYILLGAKLTKETEELVSIIESDPGARAAILTLLERRCQS